MTPSNHLLLCCGLALTLAQRQSLDALGPMSVGKDGSLNRIANWDELTPQEREAAKVALKRRNAKRLEKLRRVEANAASQQSPKWWRHLYRWFARLRRLEIRWASDERRRNSTKTSPATAAGAAAAAAHVPAQLASSLPQLDFAPEFVANVLSGAKRATTRYTDAGGGGEPHLALLRAGERVQATCVRCAEPAGFGGATLRIVRVERTALSQLGDELARTEGLESADELRAILRRFYPALVQGDEHDHSVAVLHFEVELDGDGGEVAAAAAAAAAAAGSARPEV